MSLAEIIYGSGGGSSMRPCSFRSPPCPRTDVRSVRTRGAGTLEVLPATPCGCVAATPMEPPRGLLGATCEHGNRWRLLAFYRWVPAEAWCGPANDGCTVEATWEGLVGGSRKLAANVAGAGT